MPARMILVVAALAVAGLLPACGGNPDQDRDERDIVQVITQYLGAVARGDGEAACSHLTENGQLGVFEFRFAHVGPDHPEPACADVVEESPLRGEASLRTAQVDEVEVDVDQGTARATVGGISVTLERAGDEWRINEFGVAGRLAGESPPM